MKITAPVSIGELLDKVTILEIKLERISDESKRANISRELDELTRIRRDANLYSPELEETLAQLKMVNEKLWDIEDHIREKEQEQEFDDEFTQLARSVYITNDQRAVIKKSINELTGSELVEEKSYKGT